MIFYPATFEETCDTGDGFMVSFRDVPEAITFGYTFVEAVEMSQDALRVSMDFYDEADIQRPSPSAFEHGDVMIQL